MTTRDEDGRILSCAQCVEIAQHVMRVARGDGSTSIRITGWWSGELRWARNRVNVGADRRDVTVTVEREIHGEKGLASGNQIDAISLASVVSAAERIALYGADAQFEEVPLPPVVFSTPAPSIWSDTTYNTPTAERGELARHLVEGAEAKGMLSAGYLEMRAMANAFVVIPDGRTAVGALSSSASASTRATEPASLNTLRYEAFTQAQCSMTVRHPQGTGSGWAGLSGYDWKRIDASALAERALEKCIASIDPVRIEPGRYTVVLEPQAVCDFVALLFLVMNRRSAESGGGPWAAECDSELKVCRSKLGLQVIDSRISISHDPMDPQLGVVPSLGLAPLTWFDHGILKTLEYDRNEYALRELNGNTAEDPRPAFRMSGGDTGIDEMIASTKRGLLVTRFSNLTMVDWTSVLATGVTRDGLWLIENGTISKSVKNMRITESPIFMLNRVEQLGVPVPVFRPSKDPDFAVRSPFSALMPAIVPSLKAADFSFTALNDAV